MLLNGTAGEPPRGQARSATPAAGHLGNPWGRPASPGHETPELASRRPSSELLEVERVLSRVLVLRVLPVVAALTLSATASRLASRTRPAQPASERLPDLDQATPVRARDHARGLGARPVYRLGFRSAVDQRRRRARSSSTRTARALETETMVADQLVERDGAPQEVVPDVGELRYVVSPDHRHWHLLGFDRYELRRAGAAGARAVRGSQDRLLPRRPLRGHGPPPAGGAARARLHEPLRPGRPGAPRHRRRESRSATATTTRPTSRASTCP